MDSVVYEALGEICSTGVNGIDLRQLWPKLHSSLSAHSLHPCPAVKNALWTNIRDIPSLHFQSRGVPYSPQDPKIQSFEEAEELNLNIVASEHLRNSFVGIYDLSASDAGISQPQRRALERLAIARTNGVTQNELAKEFGMKGNKIFYILRNLESRGLIVRQPTIVRTKESCLGGELKNNSIVNTNLLHLYRYAKHLGCQQRLEITIEDNVSMDNGNAEGGTASGNAIAEDCTKGDVHIKDYLPALRAICDKLEQAVDKVLVISDIKRDLGYRGSSGHKAWRNICHRLKDAHLVEEFRAKLNNKEVNCLRLLEKFSSKNFDPKTPRGGTGHLNPEQPAKVAKRGQITDQLIELPIEHQIYDMIDAEGSRGLTITEACKRLGINSKRYYTRLLDMFSRFGMHLKAEGHNRGVAYRVWTPGNFNPETSNVRPCKLDYALAENNFYGSCTLQANAGQAVEPPDSWSLKDNARGSGEIENTVTQMFISRGSAAVECKKMLIGSSSSQNLASELSSIVPETERQTGSVAPVSDAECSNMMAGSSSSQNLASELTGVVPESKLQIVSTTPVSDAVSLERTHSTSSTPQRRRSYQTYPRLNLNAVNAQREHRILEMLQEEKFLIKPELHRHLESLEKEKHSVMDRKTLERTLNKLQQEGHCQCIRVSVPVVTNCGRSRTVDVVLHPSVYNVSPKLLSQIHERLRSFEVQIRTHGSSRLKNGQSVPVLNTVERIKMRMSLDDQAEKSEALRTNGFILAKMVRTKLLHIFLWGYLSGLPGWGDALSSGELGYDQQNPHSTCKLLELDAAIKTMPVELFLQVAGSTEKFEDMIDKCRKGLRLFDLPLQEYKSLMNTRATGRLSCLIDILRRLKLIRMISGEHLNATEVPHATLRHSLELKPYIEEPVSTVLSSSGFGSLDLRPNIRHDFVLSSRKAVDEYWNTLEYCYAAADSKAALHAFPGSAVHEVFFFRSWASVRVMTADQRAELLKRIMKDDPDKKLSFKHCEQIAQDLKLTLEQVLRVYYDKRQKRISNVQGPSTAKEDGPIHTSATRKRKRVRPMKSVNLDSGDGESIEQSDAEVSNVDDRFPEEQPPLSTCSEHEKHFPNNHTKERKKAIEELGSNVEHEEEDSFISRHGLSRQKSTRQKRYSWTEDADRQLVMEYVKRRAALGVKFHRTDWASVPNLPAPIDTCKRRMAQLNSNIKFRKAVMRFCNMLSERYAKHLEKFQDKLGGDKCSTLIQDKLCGDSNMTLFRNLNHNSELNVVEPWDDFNNKNITVAFDEVLQYKKRAKLESTQDFKSAADCHKTDGDAEEHHCPETILASSATGCKEVPNHSGRVRISSRHRIPQKYIRLMNGGKSAHRRVYESLAVSNAVELFKLVFFSTSTTREVPNLLAGTLRRYSEHDLSAAFNYLRENKIMVGGSGSSPYGLSLQFLHSISASPFPTNTRKRAVKISSWLHAREKELLEEGIDLPSDLQCGDVFHLCALVSSGELSISPCLPNEGVGEAETLKRKSDSNADFNVNKAKKIKTIFSGEGEIISRTEKGFPGIRLSVTRSSMPIVDTIAHFRDVHFGSSLTSSEQEEVNLSGLNSGHCSANEDCTKENLDSLSPKYKTVAAVESPWEPLMCYATHLISLSSARELKSSFSMDLFRTVSAAIQKAGDQGLSMLEICQVIDMNMGAKMAEIIVEVLEAFGHALKVNAYDSVRVVDSLYRSKYFLTSLDLSVNPKNINDKGPTGFQQENHDGCYCIQKEGGMDVGQMHRVTILNNPRDVVQPSREVQSINGVESCTEATVISCGRNQQDGMVEHNSGDSSHCIPILPWINGDGTINLIIYKGLVRRILGIVMQNPGILEDNILRQMNVLNRQSCRKLLELMIIDGHIAVRKMCQATSSGPPSLLGCLLRSSMTKPELIFREHFFANPTSTSLL